MPSGSRRTDQHGTDCDPRVETHDRRRTRGGWIPSGTGAERRATHQERGNARGQRARQILIDAACRVFERDGYLNASVEDIVNEAGVARGSFYTYFPSKLEVFRVLLSEMGERIHASVARPPGDGHLDPHTALDQANRRYIETYRQTAGIYGLAEQLATIDPEIKRTRHESHQRHVARVADTIRRWQRRGVADPTIDPVTTAAALVSMTSNLCFWQFVGGDNYDDEELARTIQQMWVRATGLRRRANPAWRRAGERGDTVETPPPARVTDDRRTSNPRNTA